MPKLCKENLTDDHYKRVGEIATWLTECRRRKDKQRVYDLIGKVCLPIICYWSKEKSKPSEAMVEAKINRANAEIAVIIEERKAAAKAKRFENRITAW